MKTQTKKALMVASVVPTALVLAACRGDMGVQINEDGSGVITMSMEDTTGQLTGLMTCDDLASEMGSEDELEGATYEVNDISNGGNLACEMVITSTESMIDGDTFIDNGDTYTFVMQPGELGDVEDFEAMGMPFEFNMSVTMPGDIVEATNGGQVSGTTATYTGTDWMSSGFEVTGNKSASGTSGGQSGSDADDPTDGDDDPTGIEGPDITGGQEDPGTNNDVREDRGTESESDSDGFPTWAWFAIGGGVLLLLIIAGVAIAMSSKKKNQNNNQQFGGYQGQFGAQPQNGAYGQPQQGQYGGQPQQGQYGGQQYGGNPNQGGQQPPSYNPNNPQGPYQG